MIETISAVIITGAVVWGLVTCYILRNSQPPPELSETESYPEFDDVI